MEYPEYKEYLDTKPGLLRLVTGSACDLCDPIISITWNYGRPWLCEDHARELNLLW